MAEKPAQRVVITKQLERIASDKGRRVAEVFGDWCACCAIAYANAADKVAFRAPPERAAHREAEYMRIVGRYGDAVQLFPPMLGELVMELEREPRDVLGELYMELGSPNERMGQFFTPFSLSRVAAEMSMGDVVELVQARGYVSVSEPACGSGGMVIAASEVMREKGLNPQRQMPTHACDLSITAVHMTYLQLSLLGIPAQVVHADTLRLQTVGEWPVWHTLHWQLGAWDLRNPFSAREGRPAPETAPEALAPVVEAPAGPPEEQREPGQLALF